ncbi:MAG TPA: hypothetical protein VH085_04830 [Nocardioides sp.]|nr:hypothetical protein [Nocardioides sp.]
MTTKEPENAWAGQGAVMLDIGGDVGALVVAMPESTVGLEVEIRPLDGQHVHEHGHEHGHEHLAHVAVVARPVGDGVQPSLVFPELEAGSYELFEKGCPDAVALWATVDGGSVTSTEWPV